MCQIYWKYFDTYYSSRDICDVERIMGICTCIRLILTTIHFPLLAMRLTPIVLHLLNSRMDVRVLPPYPIPRLLVSGDGAINDFTNDGL